MSLWVLWISSLLSCLGQLCQKQAALGTSGYPRLRHLCLWLGLAIFCLAGAMLLWLQVLRTLPVGLAYPMMSMNFIWITLAARWLWHEPVSGRHWLGIACIIGGIALLGRAV